MGFARFPKLTGHHSICYGIKFYTTFNASATRSISRCFSSSVICTYRFIVMPILECPRILCKVLGFIPPSNTNPVIKPCIYKHIRSLVQVTVLINIGSISKPLSHFLKFLGFLLSTIAKFINEPGLIRAIGTLDNPFSKFFSFEIFSHFEAPFQAKSP